MRRRLHRIVPGLLVLLALVAACSSNSVGPSASASTEASTSAPPSVVGVEQYSTTSFVVPLTVTVDPLLKSPPTADDPHIVSWDAATSDNNKVRFLVPVEVYAPGSTTAEVPPADYLAYLKGQSSAGAVFSDETAITVDGRAATLMTATTTADLDGSLGCPVAGGDQADDCFGIQSDLSVRIAVIDMGGGTTLLTWARTSRDAPDADFIAMFERMLASVRFTQP